MQLCLLFLVNNDNGILRWSGLQWLEDHGSKEVNFFQLLTLVLERSWPTPSVGYTNWWNKLEQEDVDCGSVNEFKNTLNKLRKRKMGFFVDRLIPWLHWNQCPTIPVTEKVTRRRKFLSMIRLVVTRVVWPTAWQVTNWT